MQQRVKAANVVGKAMEAGMMPIEMMIRMKEVCRGRSSGAGRREVARVVAPGAAVVEGEEEGVAAAVDEGEVAAASETPVDAAASSSNARLR